MKTFLAGAVAAIGLTLGITAKEASAYWVTRVYQQWDPLVGAYVAVQQRVWVPDPVLVPAPIMVTQPIVVPGPSYRYGPGIIRPIPTIGSSWYYSQPAPSGWGFGMRF